MGTQGRMDMGTQRCGDTWMWGHGHGDTGTRWHRYAQTGYTVTQGHGDTQKGTQHSDTATHGQGTG